MYTNTKIIIPSLSKRNPKIGTIQFKSRTFKSLVN